MDIQKCIHRPHVRCLGYQRRAYLYVSPPLSSVPYISWLFGRKREEAGKDGMVDGRSCRLVPSLWRFMRNSGLIDTVVLNQDREQTKMANVSAYPSSQLNDLRLET